ncbi:MAG: nucleoside hydrolase [Myxococcota bacterium]|nr:nucleoside hydrolase [Myxococcota bacterium]
MSRRIVLDTDIGGDVDDSLCLALALASPEIELAAVTAIGGGSRTRARVASKLLGLAGRSEIPVFAGCRVPVLGGSGVGGVQEVLGDGQLEPGEEPPIEAEHGVDALLRLFGADPELELVMIGPMTNLAVALMKDPDLAGSVRQLTVMGGHLRRVAYGGHVFARGIDYNLCSDPQASLVALRSGIPTRLVTADVTLQSWITEADLETLEARGTPFHSALAAGIRCWTPIQDKIFGAAGCDMSGDNVAFLHDPLALAAVYDEGFCRFEDLEVEPVISDGVFLTRECEQARAESFPFRCAIEVDADAFRNHFMDRVLGFEPGPFAAGGELG